MSFSSLGLEQYILESIQRVGYKKPTPIQEQAIPHILEGVDLIAEAQTGTGKTACFALPIIQMLQNAGKKKKKADVRALVLVPTRELALQVSTAFETYGQCAKEEFRSTPLIGGEDIEQQLKELRYGTDVAVATPGRLLEIMERNEIRLFDINVLVLDEADKMLALGFADELNKILKSIPETRQNLLFSATISDRVLNLTKPFIKNPVRISIEEDLPSVETITQRVIEVNRSNRGPLLRHLLKTEGWNNVLVFVASKKASRNVTEKLIKEGVSAGALHGNLSQEDRNFVLRQFKNRNIDVLVATDLASRGIDIYKLTCVINYDLPRSPNEYIHRIGRTGRAGKSGIAISFVDHIDQKHFQLIEKKANIALEREQIEGFELTGKPPKPSKGKPPVKGKYPSKKDKLRQQKAAEAESVKS